MASQNIPQVFSGWQIWWHADEGKTCTSYWFILLKVFKATWGQALSSWEHPYSVVTHRWNDRTGKDFIGILQHIYIAWNDDNFSLEMSIDSTSNHHATTIERKSFLVIIINKYDIVLSLNVIAPIMTHRHKTAFVTNEHSVPHLLAPDMMSLCTFPLQTWWFTLSLEPM